MRRRRTLAARREGAAILVMVPDGMAPDDERRAVDSLVARFLRKEAVQRRPADGVELDRRAEELARLYLDPVVGAPVRPSSVRWVSNQQHRWGSCTPATGQIRLSGTMIDFPSWVVDCVLLHELAHLVEPNHSDRFKALAGRHPRSQEADGFLTGWSWARRGEGAPPGLDADLGE